MWLYFLQLPAYLSTRYALFHYFNSRRKRREWTIGLSFVCSNALSVVSRLPSTLNAFASIDFCRPPRVLAGWRR
jgi:hypothetical protein